MNVSSRFDVAGFGVIVTGGASGLGLAYGEVMAAHGARVTLSTSTVRRSRRRRHAWAERGST